MTAAKVIGPRVPALHMMPCPDHVAATPGYPVRFHDWCRRRIAAGEHLAVDLFSGAGGLSLGLEDAGWTVAASVDHYAAALETHAANFGGLTLDWDLGGQEVRDRFVGLFKDTKVDLVAGGPPCQPFSQAGRSKIRHLVEHHGRSAEDPRRELWRAFADIAIRLEPRAILMENVPNMGLGDDFLVLRTLAEQLQSRGYEVRVTLASAREHGVPQRRRRMILLARNDGFEIQWPTSKPEVPLRDAIGDLPNLHGGTGARQMRYAPSSRSGYSELMRGRIPETEEHLIHDHYTRPVREDDQRIFESMTPSTLYSDLPADQRRYRADIFKDKYHRLDPDEPSRSITAHIAKDGYAYIHPSEARTLTVREAARIQSFPDRFRFAGTRSDAFKQIGNAVPPLLGKAAASALHWDQRQQLEVTVAGCQKAVDEWVSDTSSTISHLIPGHDGVTDLVALAVSVASTRSVPPQKIEAWVSPLHGEQEFTEELLQECWNSWDERNGSTTSFPLRSLARLVGWGPVEAKDISVINLLGLSPNQIQVFLSTAGERVLVRSQPCLRLASRVLGDGDKDSRNRGTKDLPSLALLVGAGSDAPARMASIRLIAQQYCHRTGPDCSKCPLSAACVFHGREGGDMNLGRHD